ncbi:MAG: DUF370 domain-containing protein [Lachnospiraceae bacterium]|nr:DUF370 domain-containing protein [Lachnospiraceae bacterium]
MSNRLINVGFGNMVNLSKICCVLNPDSAPVKRMVQSARDNGLLIDATQGRKTKSVIAADDGRVILSALKPATVSLRAEGDTEFYNDDEEE